VALLAPPGSDTALASRLFDELQLRFTELGLRWQTQASADPVDLAGTHLRLVIALPRTQDWRLCGCGLKPSSWRLAFQVSSPLPTLTW
jgi:hypothetical protein